MNRCSECDAPLPINGSQCPKCGALRNDIGGQQPHPHKMDPISKVLTFFAMTIFDIVIITRLLICAVIGFGVGAAMYYFGNVNLTVCVIVGVVVTFVVSGLMWFAFIFLRE